MSCDRDFCKKTDVQPHKHNPKVGDCPSAEEPLRKSVDFCEKAEKHAKPTKPKEPCKLEPPEDLCKKVEPKKHAVKPKKPKEPCQVQQPEDFCKQTKKPDQPKTKSEPNELCQVKSKFHNPDFCPPPPPPDPCGGEILWDYTEEAPSRGPPIYPEEIFAWQWRRCINDLVWKLGCGIFLGFLGSKLIFQKRKWPTIIGAGIGMGWASENCERELRSCFSSN
ncbi:uncharacterized protein [Halyomorpha halys]|uniref:uncharacterized protein n=1 Tax=Halyomorpha halys TaxID=286706 RepID=UPI0006D4D2E6|nr:protein PYRICULARIA ORYZAE RESISTANCE 21-like [Halyomorpha halys]